MWPAERLSTGRLLGATCIRPAYSTLLQQRRGPDEERPLRRNGGGGDRRPRSIKPEPRRPATGNRGFLEVSAPGSRRMRPTRAFHVYTLVPVPACQSRDRSAERAASGAAA